MNKIRFQQPLAMLMCACVSATVWAADGAVELRSDNDKVGYALGYQIGGDFKRQKIELKQAAVQRGIADAQQGASPLMSAEEMHATLVELKRKVVAQEREAMPQLVTGSANATASAVTGSPASAARPQLHAQRLAATATEGAREFMEKNSKQKGIVTLPSGVQYRVLKEGAGKQARAEDKVALIYRGALINGKEFGNSDRGGKPAPEVFSVAMLVPGVREAISHMSEGAKWQVFVPPQLGFDASTPLYRKVTVFEVELVAVNP